MKEHSEGKNLIVYSKVQKILGNDISFPLIIIAANDQCQRQNDMYSNVAKMALLIKTF